MMESFNWLLCRFSSSLKKMKYDFLVKIHDPKKYILKIYRSKNLEEDQNFKKVEPNTFGIKSRNLQSHFRLIQPNLMQSDF